jgi:hypothetical protein
LEVGDLNSTFAVWNQVSQSPGHLLTAWRRGSSTATPRSGFLSNTAIDCHPKATGVTACLPDTWTQVIVGGEWVSSLILGTQDFQNIKCQNFHTKAPNYLCSKKKSSLLSNKTLYRQFKHLCKVLWSVALPAMLRNAQG